MMFHSILIAMSSLVAVQPAPGGDIPANLKAEYIERVDSADCYIREERWADAERCLVEALRIDPANFNNSLIHSNIGIIKGNRGDLEGAIASFTLGLNIAPSSTTLLSNRARTYLVLDNRDGARADLEEILRIDPRNQWALKMIGVVMIADGDYSGALAHLRKIENPDPDSVNSMAYCLRMLGRNDEALEMYDRLIHDSPTPDSYFERGLFLLLTDRLTEAAEDIREGLAVDPRNGNLFLLRAYYHKLMHKSDLAEIDKKMACEYGAETQLIEMLFGNEPAKKK